MNKKMKIQFILSLLLFSSVQAGANYLTDTLFWSGQFDIYDDVYIDEQTTLVIEPGTIITVHNRSKIETNGNVFANGQFDNKIIFTAADTVGLYDTAAHYGGWNGLHLLNNPNGKAVFNNCVFKYGKANVPGSWHTWQYQTDTLSANRGGAMRVVDYGSIKIDSCSFLYNFARTRGGGIYCDNVQKVRVSKSFFLNNKTLIYGGAIYSNEHDSIFISNNEFRNNSALFWYTTSISLIYHGDGSALYVSNSWPGLAYCLVGNNLIHNNTGIRAVFFSTQEAHVINNILTNNFNLRTLQFSRLPSINRVYNNTIAHNWFWGFLPGIYTASEDILIYNNILWNNLSNSSAPLNHMVIEWHYHQPTVFHNLIWEGLAPGSPMITADPLFVNPAPGYGPDYNGWEYDWSLQDISPAVNTGTPDTTGLHIPPFDLLGNPRIFGGRIDMGAYENQNVWVSLPENPLVNAKLIAAPNPFRDMFVVELFGPEKVKRISVYNQTGSIVRQIETLWHEGLVSIDMNGFASGLYVLVVEYENGTVKTEKMVKL
jgi:predicted outer membrane repeat protein